MLGISPMVSYAMIILIAFVALAIVLLFGAPAIDRAREAAVINEAMQNMKTIANAVKDVASGGVGGMRNLQLKITNGEYKVNEKANSIDFTYVVRSDIMQSGVYIQEGDITVNTGANAEAYESDLDNDGNADYILENEIMKIAILKNGSSTSYADITTNSIIRKINFKDTNANVTPSEFSVILDDYAESSSGTGYSEIVKTGYHLPKAEAVVHMNTSFINYDILFTLQSGADFIMVKILNAYYK